MAISCLIGKFICFSPQFTRGWSTSRPTTAHTGCGGEQSSFTVAFSKECHGEFLRTSLWRCSPRPSGRNYFKTSLNIKAHSVTKSQGKSKDTDYFINLNYPETTDYFWKHMYIHMYIHSFFQDPSTVQLHRETKLTSKIPTPLSEVNTAKPRRASRSK